MSRGDEMRFCGTLWDKRLYAGVFVVYSLLMAGYVFAPGKGRMGLRIAVAVSICVMLWFGWHGRRLGQVVADKHGVRAYGAVRRWHWTWAELDHFSTGKLTRSMYTTGHETLIAHTRDGRVIPLPPINASPKSKATQVWVRDAAAALNRRIASDR